MHYPYPIWLSVLVPFMVTHPHRVIIQLNTLRPRRNEQHFADDIFKRIFSNENVWISTKISLKFVPNGPINNIPALVQIMAWRRSDAKPLSEPMMVSLPTHICVTRPQWVKGKPVFHKLQTISTWNFQEVLHTNNCLHDTFKMWGHHINFCITAILNLWKINVNF